jgi:ribosome biogenesis GTPase
MKLEIFGWNDFFKARFSRYSNQGLLPGRVTIQHKDRYVLFTEQGEVSGKASSVLKFPAFMIFPLSAIGLFLKLIPAINLP